MDNNKKSKKQLIKELEKIKGINSKLEDKLKDRNKASGKLDLGKDAYRLYFESQAVPVLIVEKTGGILDANNAALNLYGYKKNELLKISIKDITAELVKGKYKQIKLTSDIKFHIKKDGTVFPVKLSESLLKINNQSVNIISINDASKELKAKIKHDNKINFLQEIINSSPGFIHVTDKKGKIILANKNLLHSLRHSPDKIIGKTVYDLFPRSIASEMNRDHTLLVENKLEKIEKEERYVNADGDIRWLYTIKLPLKDGKGKVKNVIGISTDINEQKLAEEALKEREQNYRSLIESSPDPIYVFQENKLVLVNQAWQELFGYTAKEVASSGFSEMKFVAPESKKIILKRLKKRLNNIPVGSRYEMRGLTKEGNLIDLEVSVSEIYWNGKKAVQGIYRDITERKKIEEALRREAFIFDNLYDAVIITDMEGKIINWNSAAANMYGYKKEEVLNSSSEILNKKSLHITLTEQIIRTVINEGKWTGEINFVRKDGSEGISETVVFPFLDPQGEKIALVGVNKDITKRKITEDALRESEYKFRQIAEFSLVGIYLIQDGLFRYVNPKLAEIFGYKREEVIDKLGPQDVTPPDSFKAVNNNILKRLKGEIESVHYEFQGLTKDKRIIDVEVYGAISRYKGKPAVIGTLLDITKRKRIESELIKAKEKAEESDKLKSEFLAQMSHEVRSPINVILSYNSFLRDELAGKLDPNFQGSFDSIDSAGKRLLRTIDLILNMSALQNGTIDFSFEPVDLGKIMRGLMREFDFAAKSKNLKLSFNYCSENLIVSADEYIVTEIFQNLIGNAVKYTENGKVEINSYNKNGKESIIEIKDTGVGISKEFLPKIFDPFSQEESGYSRRYEGNGLGLALVKKYIELIGAEIKVESEKGVGSIFTVTFRNN